MSELKPCPFCGGEADPIHQSFDAFYVICHGCYTTGKTYKTEAEAIAAWNTRAVENAELLPLMREEGGAMSEYIVEFDKSLGIDTLTVADLREEIVRCRDCKWNVEESRWCKRVNEFGGFTWMPITSDGFCAWGERADKQTVEVWQPASSEDVTCHE